MAQNQHAVESALEIDRLATQLAKDPHSKVFMPLAEEYGKVGMWQEAAGVLEDGLKLYPGFITAMVALGCAYDHMGQAKKAKAILEESVKLSPENLRAHRTLIKIYQSQGLNESALQSCAVILAVNPRDEEALSVQSVLGGLLKGKKELEPSTPTAPVAYNPSVQTATTPSAPPDITPSTSATRTVLDLSISTPAESAVASADIEVVPSPSPQAEVVAQLESWLRNIESRRHNRDATNEPHPKVS
jgi:tetratricopeptide (TPR) repeat protein